MKHKRDIAKAFACLLFLIMTTLAAAENLKSLDISERISTEGKAVVVLALQEPQLAGKSIDYRKNRNLINSTVFNTQSSVLSRLNAAEYKIIHRYQSIPGLVLEVYSEDTLLKLRSNTNILRIDMDEGGSGSMNQSRPWINADDAQTNGFNGNGITVAVLDTGIDTNHTDLSDNLVYEHCVCNTGVNCCPTGGGSGDGPGSAEDDQGHGTHVAGIITGRGSSSPLGIAPNTGIVAVKVIDANNSFCCSADITAALDWVLNNRPDVSIINMSLGTNAEYSNDCDNQTSWTINMATAVNALRSAGVLSVVASMNNGNSATIAVPACLSGTIAVGATLDNIDSIAAFSNSSTSLDILAPGANITSTQMGGGSTTFNGTSMATPHVAAVAAMLRQATPGIPLQSLENCLLTSSVQITDSRNGLTHPRLDAMDALNACSISIFMDGFE